MLNLINHKTVRPMALVSLLVMLTFLVGCQPMPSTSSEEMTVPGASSAESMAEADGGSTSTEMAGASDANVADAEELSTTDQVGFPPIRLAIPAISFAAEIEPMAWRVVEVDGTRQAVWEIPEATVGWHINSAMPGAADNMILSGHHRTGGAVFAPLARGEVAVDDQILVTNANGETTVYQVSEVAPPIPVSGASQDEIAQMDAYQAPSTGSKLTLITGWPDFSDTHYLFIVADYIGEME